MREGKVHGNKGRKHVDGSRELYYENLEEMIGVCRRLQLSFSNEMIVLTERWLEKHREPERPIPHADDPAVSSP